MEAGVHIVGLVVPDLLDSHYAEVARAAARMLRPQGYMVLLSNSEGDAASERQALELLLACPQVEGLILASAQAAPEMGLFRRMEKRGVACVLIERKLPGVEAPFVGADDAEIGAAATEHLIARGCRHIAHIQGPESSSGAARLNGYAAALARHGLRHSPGYVAPGGTDEGAGFRAMRGLLTVNPRLDGVVCFNDAVAVGAIKAVLAAGLDVPLDIEVIGAGNLHYSDILRVPLSTIDLNSGRIGEEAAGALLRRLRAPGPLPGEEILVPFALIPRESSLRICA